MGAPIGNRNAAGQRRGKAMRFQNVSTMVTSVMQNGRSRTVKPRSIISITQDDVDETIESYQIQERNPFELGLLVKLEDGQQQHPDTPAAYRAPDPEKLKEIVSYGSIEEVEKIINEVPDSGGIMLFYRVLIELGDGLNDKRRRVVEELIEERAERIAIEDKRRRREYKDKVG